jgi:AraC-like DNA-binding protein
MPRTLSLYLGVLDRTHAGRRAADLRSRDVLEGDGQVSVRFVRRILREASACGVEVADLAERFGTELDADVARRVPRDVYLEAWELLEARSGDPALPVRMQEHLRIESDELLALLCATATNVRAAVELFVRYVGVFTTGFAWRFEDGRLELRRRVPSSRRGAELADEYHVASLVGHLRWMTGTHLVPDGIGLPAAAPPHAERMRRFLGCRVAYDQPSCWLALGEAALATPMARADGWIAQFAHQAVEKAASAVAVREDEPTFAARVRAEIEAGMGQSPDLESIASRLGVTTRTARRHLQRDGKSFREIVEDVQRKHAEHLLARSQLSIAEVGFAIGFADAASFTRAFRRWTGIPPGRFRTDRQPPR